MCILTELLAYIIPFIAFWRDYMHCIEIKTKEEALAIIHDDTDAFRLFNYPKLGLNT